MKINLSKATFSSIVGIGEKILSVEKQTGRKFLKLNRGVNAVTNIDLTDIMDQIDPNSGEFQLYAPNTGIPKLKSNIALHYSLNKDNLDNISITPGGMPALDLILQILDVDLVHFPQFYWGSYSKMATIRKKDYIFYNSFLDMDTSKLTDKDCIFLCDPNNPTGIKINDKDLINKIIEIQKTGAILIFDCPYRKLFYENIDLHFSEMPNVIIAESFSKWIGLPGVRLGFIYSCNEEFNKELNIRLLYEFNGVSSPSQVIVNQLLDSYKGQSEILKFKNKTISDIAENIEWLKNNNFLPKEIYGENKPVGIFSIINVTEECLFDNNIGSVGLDKFSGLDKDIWSKYSRVCVSVPHNNFIEYFSPLIHR